MKWQLLSLLGVFLFFSALVYSQDAHRQITNKQITPKEIIGIPEIEFSKTISNITGLAINPLMVSGGSGALRYFAASSEQKAHLPLQASPYFWIPSLLLGIIFMLSPIIPFLRKFLKATEINITKVTAIFIAVHLILNQVSYIVNSQTFNQTYFISTTLGHNLAFIMPLVIPFSITLLLIPVYVTIFFFVWILMEAINSLMLISPHFMIDWFFNIVKYSMLAIVLLTATIFPTLSLLICIVIIITSIKISGWCFRLTVFGTIFAWDLITLSHKRGGRQISRIWAFTVGKFHHVPKRTLGSISKLSNESIQFSYRPWLIFRERRVPLQTTKLAVVKGIIFPSLLDCEQNKRIFDFPPRYRSHEAAFAKHLNIQDVRESMTIRGLKAAIKWIKDFFPSHKTTEFYAST